MTPKTKRNDIKAYIISIPYLSAQHSSEIQTLPHTQAKLVHVKYRTQSQKQSNVVYAVQQQEEWKILYMGESNQPLARSQL